MPVAPITPSEAKSYVIKESDTLCEALLKLTKIGVAAWKMAKFKYTALGALTPAYRDLLCAAECVSQSEVGSTTSSNPPT